MSTNFLTIPPELRNQIYELVLLHPDPICPLFKGLQQEPTLDLLCTNKTISREASSLFYGQNCFKFTACDLTDVDSFLEKVGRQNAGHIRQILMDFPNFLYLEPGDVKLQDDSIATFANIKSNCTSLHTLTISAGSMNTLGLQLEMLDNLKVVTEALDVIDAQFRSILSLKEVIIEAYEDQLSDYIKRKMKDRGWAITILEYVEGSDLEYGDDYDYNSSYDGYNSGYDFYNNGDDYEYDFDADSDFWRRAAD